jgi:hypothetical protein
MALGVYPTSEVSLYTLFTFHLVHYHQSQTVRRILVSDRPAVIFAYITLETPLLLTPGRRGRVYYPSHLRVFAMLGVTAMPPSNYRSPAGSPCSHQLFEFFPFDPP